jgi:hypothetical protein
MPEVDAALEELASGDDGHGRLVLSLPAHADAGVRLPGAEPFDAA